MKDVTDLDVYRESLRLLRILYRFLKKLPKNEFEIISQCKRCGTSIPANIAEGWAKRSYELEFKRFLKISLGSSDELINHLRSIAIIEPQLLEEAKQIASEYKMLSRRLNKLHGVWKSKF